MFEEYKKYRKQKPEVIRTKNRRIILLWKGVVCNNKKLKLIKEQEATIIHNIFETNPIF